MKQNEPAIKTSICTNILKLCNGKNSVVECKNLHMCCDYYIQNQHNHPTSKFTQKKIDRPPYEGVEEYFIFWN